MTHFAVVLRGWSIRAVPPHCTHPGSLALLPVLASSEAGGQGDKFWASLIPTLQPQMFLSTLEASEQQEEMP